MLEPRGDLDLAQESVRPEQDGQLGVEDLDGDAAVVPEVLGEEDGGHAAAAHLALDPVAAGERGVQLFGEIGHGRWIPRTRVKPRASLPHPVDVLGRPEPGLPSRAKPPTFPRRSRASMSRTPRLFVRRPPCPSPRSASSLR